MNFFNKDRKKSANIKMLEETLASQIAELKWNSSTKDIKGAAKSGNSLGHVKTEKQYQKDREFCLQSLLTVPSPPPLHCQFQAMQEELSLCLEPPFTNKNLPLFLHQFFIDRLEQLIRHMHLLRLRWTRLAVGRLKVTETLEKDFQKRIQYLMLEYNDCIHRCKRLSVSCDLLSSEGDARGSKGSGHRQSSGHRSLSLVKPEDVGVLLRWLIYHQQISRKASCFLASIQWYPIQHKDLSTHPVPTKMADARQQTRLKSHQTHPSTQLVQESKRTFTSSTSLGSKTTAMDMIGRWIASRHSHVGDTSHKNVSSSQAPTIASSLKDAVVDKVWQDSWAGQYQQKMPTHDVEMGRSGDTLQMLMRTYNIIGPASFPSQVEQLQFYYQASRKFQSHFQTQEVSSTFYIYDKPPETGKLKKSNLTFKKLSSWCSHIQVRGRPDPTQIKAITTITKETPQLDPLLELSTHCTHLHSLQRAQYALRQHSVTIRNPPLLTKLSSHAHDTSNDTLLIWKCIYSGLDSRKPLGTDDQTEGDCDGVPKDEGFEVVEDSVASMVDMVGALSLISSKGGRRISASADEAPKDAYMGYLLLRHLRIRDMRSKCLSILNYFRSVERTLTINSQELAAEHGRELKSGKPSLLLNKRHLFSNMADLVVDHSDFLRCMEVENHDDFYAFQSDGSVQVWDSKGVAVIYDSAVQDLKELEQELMKVGSYYMKMTALKERESDKGTSDSDTDLEVWCQRNVDRFALLLDLWTCESHYLQSKMKVLNCYLEAYHHCLSPAQISSLHQAMADLLGARPRYDTSAVYFTATYQQEVHCLDLMAELLLALAQHLMKEDRAQNQINCTQDVAADLMSPDVDTTNFPFGLPVPLSEKLVVSLTGDKVLQLHSYLLEFSEGLALLASVPEAIGWTLSETCTVSGVDSPASVLNFHCKLLQHCLREWSAFHPVGSSYTSELKRQLFSSVCVCEPGVVSRLLRDHCASVGQMEAHGDEMERARVRERAKMNKCLEMLQLVFQYHHLVVSCSETEALTCIYKNQLAALDMDECHAYLRCIAFDPSLRMPADKPLDQYVCEARDMVKGGNPRLDQYVPAELKLAVHELVQGDMADFSFRTPADILKILEDPSGLHNVGVAIQCEVAHRNSLLLCVQYNLLILRSLAACSRHTTTKYTLDNMPQPSYLTLGDGSSSKPLPSRRIPEETELLMMVLKQQAVSLQLEKAPVRDHMLACYVQAPTSSMVVRKEKGHLQATLIASFSSNLSNVMYSFSLRYEIIRHYHAILFLLSKLPATRRAHFVVGNFKKEKFELPCNRSPPQMSSGGDSKFAGRSFTRLKRGKPELMSSDGETLVNLWYIPHFTEVMVMFEELSIKERCKKLHTVSRIASSLHRLLQYMCAYVELGGESDWVNNTVLDKKEYGGAWGGTEGIGTELLQLQHDISRLNNPTSPTEVADFLGLRCRVVFYQHDVTVHYYLRRTLLSTDNIDTLKILDQVSIPALMQLSHTSLNPLSAATAHNVHYLDHAYLPHPLDCNLLAKERESAVMSWAYFLLHRGLFPNTLEHTWEMGPLVYTSLVCLGPEGRSLAHGEFLGVSLMLEDVLQSSELAAIVQHDLEVNSKDGGGGGCLGEGSLDTSFLPPATFTSTKRFSSNLKPELLSTVAHAQQYSHAHHLFSHASHTAPLPPSSRPTSGSQSTISRPQSSRGSNSSPLPPNHTNASGGGSSLPVYRVELPPIDGGKLVEGFLVQSSQLEQLKYEWWLKLLDTHLVGTSKQYRDMEDAYKDRVLVWARKTLVRKMTREISRKVDEEVAECASEATFITESNTDLSGGGWGPMEAVEPAEPLNEQRLREIQVSRLLEVLEQQLLVETNKHLAKLSHLALSERERDEATLPLDLWKTSVNFKELTGLARSHVVEDFANMLEAQRVDPGDKVGVVEKVSGAEQLVFAITEDDLKECLASLSSGVLAREKECYQLYASHYESVLRSQYNQLCLKNQDIEHYRDLADRLATQTREESLVFMGNHTQGLVMEVTGLRTKLARLQQSYRERLKGLRKEVLSEYSVLVDQLFSATVAIKQKFEDYRGNLYGDMTQSLAEVKQSTAANIAKMKDRLGVKGEGPGMVRDTKDGERDRSSEGDGVRAMQESNAKLMKTITRMRTMYNWNRHKAGVAHNTEMLSMQAKLDLAHRDFLALKMDVEDEANSLKQQILVMQKQLDKVERECEMAKRNLKDEKLKRSSATKSASRNQEHFMSKTERSYAVRLDQMKHELDEREKLLKHYEKESDKFKLYSDAERQRAVRTLRAMKQQLVHERSLKLEAFHQVEDMLQQLQDQETKPASVPFPTATLLTPPNISTSHTFSHVAHTPSPALRLQLASNASSRLHQLTTSGRASALTSGGASALTSGGASALTSGGASASSFLQPSQQPDAQLGGGGVKGGASRTSQGYHRSVTFQTLPTSPGDALGTDSGRTKRVSLNRAAATTPIRQSSRAVAQGPGVPGTGPTAGKEEIDLKDSIMALKLI